MAQLSVTHFTWNAHLLKILMIWRDEYLLWNTSWNYGFAATYVLINSNKVAPPNDLNAGP